ncbi:hypothetical protein KIL84_010433 [Mauremys mutica]|uniref:Uncharacterized protein n=1 Tax=Mauremys mutica TaxID=74926 RepID=A0A9D4B1E0_9SAUR|nr:hypothetical protein KIL84_010433 [Mauremys mutica]
MLWLSGASGRWILPAELLQWPKPDKAICTSQQCKKQKEAESTVEQRTDSMGYENIDAFEGVYTSHSKVNFSCLLTGDQRGFIQLCVKLDLMSVCPMVTSSLELVVPCKELEIPCLSVT